MAQRFGRNQRRRAREALQAAQQLAETRLDAARGQASRAEAMRQEVRALEDVLDEARELLGASIALPPKHGGRHPYARGEDFEAFARPPQRLALDDITANVAREEAALKVCRMRTLLVDVENRPSRLRESESQLHMRVTLGSGEVVYAISEDALHDSPAGWLEKRLGIEIARQLVQVLGRKRQRDARDGSGRAVRRRAWGA